MIRSRLTYANVMATIAVFLALGGGAFAVKVKLKANQVKTRNIAPDAVTGAKALESSFGKVPSAGQADNSTNAANATNASTVGGLRVLEINFEAANGTAKQNILELAGVTLDAQCISAGNMDVNATTTKDNSDGYVAGVESGGADDTDAAQDISSNTPGDGGFDTGVTFDVDSAIGSGDGDADVGSFHYYAADGSSVFAHLALNETGSGCEVNGFAIGG